MNKQLGSDQVQVYPTYFIGMLNYLTHINNKTSQYTNNKKELDTTRWKLHLPIEASGNYYATSPF